MKIKASRHSKDFTRIKPSSESKRILILIPYLILQSVKSFKYKFKQSVEVIRAWGGNKDIRVPVEQKKRTFVSN